MELRPYADLCDEQPEEMGEMFSGFQAAAQSRNLKESTQSARSMDISTCSALSEEDQQLRGLQAYQCHRFHLWVMSQAHSTDVQEEPVIEARPELLSHSLVSGVFKVSWVVNKVE